MSNRLYLCLLAAATVALPAAALASPPLDSPPDTRLAVEGTAGLGTPLGLIGMSLELAPVDRVAIAAGVGYGVNGLQISVMPRVDLLRAGASAIAAGVGVSTGRWGTGQWFGIPGVTNYSHEWDWARWGNAELSATRWINPSNRLRIYAGVSYLLNPGDNDCIAEDEGDELPCPRSEVDDVGRVLPYAGIAFTFAAL